LFGFVDELLRPVPLLVSGNHLGSLFLRQYTAQSHGQLSITQWHVLTTGAHIPHALLSHLAFLQRHLFLRQHCLLLGLQLLNLQPFRFQFLSQLLRFLTFVLSAFL